MLGEDGAGREAGAGGAPALSERIARFEAAQLRAALAAAEGSASAAIAALRLPRKTFCDKLKRHGIDPRDRRR